MAEVLACEIASPRYRYLETFFKSETGLFMADPLGLAPEGERKIDLALAQLEDGIKGILESDHHQQYLRTLGKFHNYSLGNLILIWIQNQNATRVAGFNTWRDLGRFVKKGEKGIMILAPCFPPKGKPAPKPEPVEEEETEEEKIVQVPVYFKVVYVFDISQTEGKDLPEVEVPIVQGEDSRPLFDLGLQYAEKNGLKILDKPKATVSPETMGYFAPQTREIWIRDNVPQNQQTKSLFHEIAHSRAADKFGPGAEVLAESVAFAVCNHFGFDTGARSFPYVAVWARDIKVLKEKLDQVRAVTKDIIDEIVILAELRDPGRLQDIGTGFITGLGLASGFKVIEYLSGKIKSKRDESRNDASLEEWHTEGLVCKICGRPVPPKAVPEVWAGYHIKYEHRDFVKTLARDRLPWVAGLTVVGEDYPLRKEALRKLKPYTIIEVHDDGDLTVQSGGKEWIVSTEGKAYINYKLRDPAILERQMILTKEIRKRLPPLRATEHQEDPIVQVKFFTPWTNWTWYATEFDGEDEFFGLVQGHELEMGYWSLKELQSIRGPFGLYIERDYHFRPTPLSKVREALESGRALDITEGNMEDNRFERLFHDQLGMVDSWIDELRKAYEARDAKRFGQLVRDWCSMAGARDSGDPYQADCDGLQAVVKQFIRYAKQWQRANGEFPAGDGRALILKNMERALAFYNMEDPDPGKGLEDLTPAEKDRQLLLKSALGHVSKATIDMAKASEFHFNVDEKIADGLRRAWGATEHAFHEISNMIGDIVAKELNFAKSRDITPIEELADEYVLPAMKDYPGDKLTLAEITKYTKKAGAPPFTEDELESALEFLEAAGEILSFEKTAEKPKRWAATENGGLWERDIPKLIEVFKTTICKHYRPVAAFHKGSFRVKKISGGLIWLGCLKTANWKGKVCSENQALHKTIKDKTPEGMKEVRNLEKQGIEVKEYAEEGITPRDEDDILTEIAEAMNKAQPV